MAFRNFKQELQDPRPPGPSPWPFVLRMIGFSALAGGLVCAALWIWPGYLLDKPWQRPGPAPEKMALFFSSDTSGHLEPCDCTEQRWGGIAKVAGLLKTVEKPPASLAFDVGQMTGGNRLWERLAWAKYLEALGQMRFTAANLGASELSLSAAEIRQAAADSPVPLLSANLIEKETAQPLVHPYLHVVKNNLRVTVLGLVQIEPGEPLGDGLALAEPHEVLRDLLPRLRPHTDLLVLLAACDKETIEQLARAHPEIDVLLGGRVRQASREIQQLGGCSIAYQANKGQMIGRVDLEIGRDGRPGRASSSMILLDNNVPEAPAMLELVDQYNAELARLNRQGGLAALGVTVTPSPAGSNRFLGSQSCQPCHQQAYEIWKGSDHSKAHQSLVRKARDSNPDCLRCHVLALGSGDGFRGIAITPDLINVHCESCHGRASNHVQAHTDGRDSSNARMQKVLPDSCQTCHDCIRSPQFSYDPYWEKIKHGSQN